MLTDESKRNLFPASLDFYDWGALLVLGIMAILLLGSVWNDSASMDELAHIPAGYGYAAFGDYRLNPEHPPLLKALGGFSALLFLHPHFPTDTSSWLTDINGQWTQGARFLYEAGNDPDSLIFWFRVPFMLLALFFGWILYRWTRAFAGSSTALLTLGFFAFSPTFLTHSRYVTTDLGAAFAFFIGIIGYLYFLERPSPRRIVIAGVLFGVAELIKFSLVLLVPIYTFLLVAWVLSRPALHFHERIRVFFRMGLQAIALGAIGFLLVWIVYIPFVRNYPEYSIKPDGTRWTRQELIAISHLPQPQRSEAIAQIPLSQMRDAEILLSSYRFRPAVDIVMTLLGNPHTRAFGQYLLGVLMVNQRAVGGNTAYFLGEVSATGSHWYFPVLYLFKEPLALHVMLLSALLFELRRVFRSASRPSRMRRLREWTEMNFTDAAFILFIAFYWSISIASPLNIGIRHVLPTFPFIYILVSRHLAHWMGAHDRPDPATWFEWLRNIYEIYIKNIPRYLFVSALFAWLIVDTLVVFPDFMTYYNELAGGPNNGYNIATDSNYDWGQDLLRLRDYVDRHKISSIAIDYFGGGSPRYYFGDRFVPWWSSRGVASGWFAISATFRQGAFGTPAPGFVQAPEDSYGWLQSYEPVARIGSIFLYKLPAKTPLMLGPSPRFTSEGSAQR